MKKVVITGSSSGIGRATAKLFLSKIMQLPEEEKHLFEVHGIDILESTIEDVNYHHHKADVQDYQELPEIEDVDILINNAGVQVPVSHNRFYSYTEQEINTNLKGVMNCTIKYALKPLETKHISQHTISSIVNMASVSAHNGAEFGGYVASKGGVLSYTIWTAKQLAIYQTTVNSLSFGGVLTELNKPVIEDEKLWNAVMAETPMKKWMTAEEAAEWVYFLAVTNKSCTGQDIIVDNGEMRNHNFIWS